ncbi:unnamed protein product [Rotaria socialis]|uniref:Uncharacterized protein n=1 Tax=Rotaria socialis TaxID=392032 RepID=A0A821TY26_9BILA|nr:unnamed protein product [Rotaria socialis]CAF3589715.1 unnamed protein product [Rotaria socialis]CAF4484688.1 unnamed protein product [Rotaria socialis]CAF4878472.1 unnamed protein product [Rotaria socialis]
MSDNRPSDLPLLTIEREFCVDYEKVINNSLDDNNQSISNDTSSSSINENQFTFDKPGKNSQRLASHFNKIYNNNNEKSKMSTKTFLPSSSHINDRYYFCSRSTMNKKSKHKSDTTPPLLRKRYKLSAVNDCNRYYFPLDNSIKPSRKTLPHARSHSYLGQRSVTFMEGISTYLCDTPHTFSKTSDTLKYPSTASTLVRSKVAPPYQFNRFNQKYRQQQPPMKLLSSNSSSLNYIRQYYAKKDKPISDDSLEIDDKQKRLHSSVNTNRIHTQIIKNLHKSLIDRNYQSDKNRLIYFEQNVRRYLRSYENQTLQ